MMRGDDIAVVSRHNYIGRSIVLCRRKERYNWRGTSIDGWRKIVKVDVYVGRSIGIHACVC